MKHKFLSFIGIIAVLAVVGFGLSACDDSGGGGGGGGGGEPILPSLTGTVTIDNMQPEVYDTLIAVYTPGNGTGDASWQWLRNDTIISDAIHNYYDVTEADLGAVIKARISYANQSGNVTSSASAAVAQASGPLLTGTVTIDNTNPKVGDTLSASYSDGNGTGIAAWHWFRDDEAIINTNHHNYTVTADDDGLKLKVSVSYSENKGKVTSSETYAVTRSQLTGTVTIDNTNPKVGDTLGASYSDGNGTGDETWQWLKNDAVISGENSNVYKVVVSDENAVIKARVSYSNQSGYVASAATGAVLYPNLTGTVTIETRNPPRVGDLLVAHYSGGNGTGDDTWQWLRNDVIISGEINNNYEVIETDLGAAIKVRVSYANQKGSITSSATGAVVEASGPLLTGTLVIDNMIPEVGDTLTASYLDGNGAGAETWRWFRDGDTIDGANSNTYTVTAADKGSAIHVYISCEDNRGHITSDATAVVKEYGKAAINSVYYWVNEQDELAFTQNSALKVSPGEIITITAREHGYNVIRWELNGKNVGAGESYNFSALVKAKYSIGLLVEKDGKYYSVEFKITVE